MHRTTSLTADYVRSILDYDPKTGVATWKPRPEKTRFDRTFNTRFAGKQAGSPHKESGEWQIGIDGVVYYLNRVIWLHYYGEWPTKFIDHRDTDRSNNRIANLRSATNGENGRNRRPQANNTSGYKGVCFDRSRGRWMASICIEGHQFHLGRFDTPQEAAAAYRRAALRVHGAFARSD